MAVTTCRHGTQPKARRRFQRRHAILRLLPRASSHSTITKTMPALDIGAWDNRRNLVRAALRSTHHRAAARGGARWAAVRPPWACCATRSGRACRPRSRSGGHRPSPGTKDRRGYGHVGPPGFAGLLPPCADVVAGRLKAEVGALSFSPLALATSLTLTLSVRVRSVPVKPSFSAVKVPMFAMMNFLSVEQGSRPSRPVVIRPATARIHKQTGRLGPTRSERTWPTRLPA